MFFEDERPPESRLHGDYEEITWTDELMKVCNHYFFLLASNEHVQLQCKMICPGLETFKGPTAFKSSTTESTTPRGGITLFPSLLNIKPCTPVSIFCGLTRPGSNPSHNRAQLHQI